MTDAVPESSRVVWINMEQGVDCLHMVQLMPTPSQYPIILPHLNQDWF